MYENFLSTYPDKKSCHTSTTLQTSIARFVSDSWASCQYGGWNSYTLQCGICGSGIVTVNSPSGSTLQCDKWLWDDMPLNSPKRPPYWNFTSGFNFDHIIEVDMSFCTSLRNFIQIGPHRQRKITSCRFSRWRISAILDFRDPIMGLWKAKVRLPIGRE